ELPQCEPRKSERDYKAEYQRRKELKSIRAVLADLMIEIDFDYPFLSTEDWDYRISDFVPALHSPAESITTAPTTVSTSVLSIVDELPDSLVDVSDEVLVYLHADLFKRLLGILKDDRANKALQQRIYESWLFQPLKPYWEPVPPFTFQACVRLWETDMDPYAIQERFLGNPNRVSRHDSYAYPWHENESKYAHLEHLELHEKALDQPDLPADLRSQVIEWINADSHTSDLRLIPFTFGACCWYAGVDQDEYRKHLIYR